MADTHLAACRRLVISARADLAKTAAALGIAIALLGCDASALVFPDTEPARSASSSAPPISLPPDPEFDRAVAIKNESIAKCEIGGGIVAMGFGTHVVCLKPQCVEWTRDPHFPRMK
jgi:hypothetical protein